MLVRIGSLKKLRRSRTDIMEIGGRLYKYKSVEKMDQIIDIVEKQRIYMPKVSQLNDPLEGVCNMNFGFAGCSYYHDTGTLHPHYSSVLNSYRVLALTIKKDSVVMWTHYAVQFDGICIEFEDRGSFTDAVPVTYTDYLLDSRICGDSFDRVAYNSLRRKSSEWSYEDEYRIISKTAVGGEDKEYLELLPGELKCVYIGYRVDNKLKLYLNQLCNDKKIETKVMFVNPYKYTPEALPLMQYLENFREYDGEMNRCS